MLLACLKQSSETQRAIRGSGNFAVNILGADQVEPARRFAVKGPSKFDGVEYLHKPGSPPLVSDALAVLCCNVVETVRGGTHSIFVAEVL
jgi:flavin reductase (DIM6/NTAB) family NADH-FMN oxidoreductase RutF